VVQIETEPAGTGPGMEPITMTEATPVNSENAPNESGPSGSDLGQETNTAAQLADRDWGGGLSSGPIFSPVKAFRDIS